MSLLLTRHVDQYRIDLRHSLLGGLGPDCLGTGGCEPLPDQLAVKPIMLHDEDAFHGWLRR